MVLRRKSITVPIFHDVHQLRFSTLAGLTLAKLVDLPSSILDRATVVSDSLMKINTAHKKKSKSYLISRRRKAVLALKETLSQAYNGNMDDSTLYSFVAQLQDEFVQQMDRLAGDYEDTGYRESDAGIGNRFTAEGRNE